MGFMAFDVGTGNTKFAASDTTGNPETLRNEAGEQFTPTVFFFNEDGSIVIGEEAANLALTAPERAVFFAKRHLGTERVLYTAGDGAEYRARDLFRLMFEYGKKVFEQSKGDIADRCAISYPADLVQGAKRELVSAAEAARLTVVAACQEPTAAGFGAGVHTRGDGVYVVSDLGCGTFDVSILKVEGDSVTVLYTGGLEKLGGLDFSAAIEARVCDAFCEQHGFRPDAESDPSAMQLLKPQVEAAKRRLNHTSSATIAFAAQGKTFTFTLTQEEYLSLTAELTQQVVGCVELTLSEAKVSMEDVRELIPAGGGSQSFGLLAELEKRLGRAPSAHTDPQYAIVRGCFLLGRIELERRGESFTANGQALPPLRKKVTECTAHPLGVSVVVVGESEEERCAVVLPKGRPIPLREQRTFRMEHPGSTDVSIVMLEGRDGSLASECRELGRFELEDLPPTYDAPHPIQLTMDFGRDGIVSAVAKCGVSGKEAELAVSTSE